MGAAVAADRQHRHERGIPSGEKREVGPDGPHGGDQPDHVGDVAAGILDADDPRKLLGEPLHGGHVDRRRKHRNVVERDVDRAEPANLAEIGIHTLRREAVVERRHHRHRTGPRFQAVLTGPDRLGDVRLGGTGHDGHPPASRRADDLHDPLPLLDGEPQKLSRRSVRIEAVHAPIDEPRHIAGEFVLVDAAPFIERHHVGNEDAGNRRG